VSAVTREFVDDLRIAQRLPVAAARTAARTYNHRGVVTATPKDCVLGFTR
jgi:hypothetical protein